jgi:hypothetical protein
VPKFLDDAQRIFEVARDGGSEPCNLTILVHPETGIHMIADSRWPLASLLSHHGATVSYRVSREKGRVRVQGRTARQTCDIDMETPAAVARRLLAGSSYYTIH